MERTTVKQTQEVLYSSELENIEKNLDSFLQAKHDNLLQKHQPKK